MRRRVAMVQEIIAPYRIPVFNEIARKADFDFKLFFLSATQNERLWPVPWDEMQFPYEVLPGVRWEKGGVRVIHFNWGGLQKIAKYDTIVTGGWHQPIYYPLHLYAKIFGKRFLFWSESHAGDLRKRNPVHDFLRKIYARSASGAIVSGAAAKNYLETLGVKPDRIWTAPNAIDLDYFKNGKPKTKSGDLTILYVGRMVEEKGVFDLLEAYRRISAKRADVNLILCGEGGDRIAIESRLCEHRLTRAKVTGFLTRDELLRHYQSADLFVLPSRTEPWGLVVNEAMACGLPVIASDKVGAAPDLVHPDENGYVFPSGNIDVLTGYIAELLRDPQKRIRFGESSKRIIENFSPAACAQGFLDAVHGPKRIL